MKRKNIVLVEVNPDDQLLLTRAAGQLYDDAELTVINSLEKLHSSLQKSNNTPDLIIIDLHHGAGFDADYIYKVRGVHKLKHVPILLLAERFSERLTQKAYASSIQSCIAKSTNIETWNRIIRQVTNYWLNIHTQLKAG